MIFVEGHGVVVSVKLQWQLVKNKEHLSLWFTQFFIF